MIAKTVNGTVPPVTIPQIARPAYLVPHLDQVLIAIVPLNIILKQTLINANNAYGNAKPVITVLHVKLV